MSKGGPHPLESQGSDIPRSLYVWTIFPHPADDRALHSSEGIQLNFFPLTVARSWQALLPDTEPGNVQVRGNSEVWPKRRE